ncbi:MAG TPA: YetF domain-containing protein [Actinomycetota bacterium]|nr:YetF domain-containing protein [Actinomycetota bacterium]
METVLRAAIMYLFLLVVIRAMGKKELSGMSSFDLILLIIMGDLIQQGVTQQDASMTAAMLAVGTIALMLVVFSYATFRWNKAAPVLEGVSVLVVKRGRVQRQALEVERLTEDEVKAAAREQGIPDLRNVLVGVLEEDGKFSFITFDGKQHPQAETTAG